MDGNVYTCPHCGRKMGYLTAQPHLRANHEPELRKAQVAARKKRKPLMEQLRIGAKGEN